MTKHNTPLSQQDFLRNAMGRLGLTRDQFADRFGIKRRRLDNWLLPEDSEQVREIDPIAKRYIEEVLHYQDQYRYRIERLVREAKAFAGGRAKDAARGAETKEFAALMIRKYGQGMIDAVAVLFDDRRAADPVSEVLDRIVANLDPDWRDNDKARWEGQAGLVVHPKKSKT